MFELSAFGDAGYDVISPHSLMNYGAVAWVLGNVLIVGTVGVIALRDRRYLLIACALAAMLGNPRLTLYNVGYLYVPARVPAAEVESGSVRRASSRLGTSSHNSMSR